MVKIRVVPARVIVHESEVRGVAVLSRVGVARGHCPSLIADEFPAFGVIAPHVIREEGYCLLHLLPGPSNTIEIELSIFRPNMPIG